MATKELLRISMSPAQVREACAAWARCQCSMSAHETTVSVEGGTVADNAAPVTVVFRKKRAPAGAAGNNIGADTLQGAS